MVTKVVSRRIVVRRNGTVRQREHYLRDDIPCGHPSCLVCPLPGSMRSGDAGATFPSFRPRDGEDPDAPRLLMTTVDTMDDSAASDSTTGQINANVDRLNLGGADGASKVPKFGLPAGCKRVAIVDTNVVLHQMDLLEMPEVTGVVVLATVISEVRRRSVPLYKRLLACLEEPKKGFFTFNNEHSAATYVGRKPGESPNDRNDRAIMVAASWYAAHLKPLECTAVLVTNDAECGRIARRELSVSAMTIRKYVTSYLAQHPVLLDMLAEPVAAEAGSEGDEEDGGGGGGGEPGRSRKRGGGGAGADADGHPPEHLSERELRAGIAAGRLVQGTLRVNRSNTREATVFAVARGIQLLIQGAHDINRSVDGDVVAVEPLDESEWRAPGDEVVEGEDDPGVAAGVGGDANGDAVSAKRAKRADGAHRGGPSAAKAAEGRVPSGRVVGVLKRNWRSYCGSLGPDVGKDTYLFIPVDQRVPWIRFRTRQADNLRDKRFIVHIDAWERRSKNPSGHFVRAIGPIGDRDAETEVICVETQVQLRPFTDQVLRCLPREGEDWRVSLEDLATRTDLRDLNVMSVDPPGCTDIDDAVHVRELPNGNLELGVHIADVTHFVKPNTPLDLEARARGTTVYLVDRRIDMVPPLLGTNLCSLRPHVERLAFSVTWEIEGIDPSDNRNNESLPGDDKLRIVSRRCFKSVIASKEAFAYGEAQARMDDPSLGDRKTADLRLLCRITRVLRKRRVAAGSLVLASPAVTFSLDRETQDPDGMSTYQLREANGMIEDLMLLANVAVAEVIQERFPESAMLRRHPPPVPQLYDPLIALAKTAGVKLDFTSSLTLAQSLDAATVPGDPYFNTLIRVLTTRVMQQAVYFASGSVPRADYLHYGLASPIYTHFTSPIRRYADVCVHRALAAVIGVEPLDESLLQLDAAQEIAEVINERHKLAQTSGRDSVALHTLLYFRSRTVVEVARVTRVRKNAFQVIVPRYGFEGTSYLDGEWKGKFTYDPEAERLTGAAASIGVFQAVVVEISVDTSVPHRHRLKVRLVDPNPPRDKAGLETARKAEIAEREAQGTVAPRGDGEEDPSGAGGRAKAAGASARKGAASSKSSGKDKKKGRKAN